MVGTLSASFSSVKSRDMSGNLSMGLIPVGSQLNFLLMYYISFCTFNMMLF